MFSRRYWSHIQDFQVLFKRIFIIVRCPSFRKCQTLEFQNSEIYKQKSFVKLFGTFLGLFTSRCPGVSKNKNNWFWGVVTGSKIEIIEMWSFCLPHKQIEILLYQIEAENSRSFETYSLNICSTKLRKLADIFQYCFLWFSDDFHMIFQSLVGRSSQPFCHAWALRQLMQSHCQLPNIQDNHDLQESYTKGLHGPKPCRMVGHNGHPILKWMIPARH